MKRTFTGQMMLTVCLIFLTLIVFSTATQMLHYRTTVGIIKEELVNTAEGMRKECLECVDKADSKKQMQHALDFAYASSRNDVLLCNDSGKVLLCSCGERDCAHVGTTVPAALLNRAGGDMAAFLGGVEIPCYEGKRMAAAISLMDRRSGNHYYVVASKSPDRVTETVTSALKANLIVVLTVMLLSIPLVWFLVRRQTKPMKQLTQAARKMAHGQMDVRVPTDEADTAELNELAVAFNNMAEALQKSEQKRQEFVANVSHELKTPMTTISGYMDGMLDGTIPPEQHQKYMTVISDEVKRLSRLVRSMLEISRLQDQGVSPERKVKFDICQTVGEVLLSFEQKINGKHLEVETDLPDIGARVLADRDAITQVVYNLIDNAVKFCPDGGTLGLAVTETRKGKYLVSVKNTGPTIPPEELPLVFDRFHKTDKSRSVDRDGWGLGLYIVRTIVLSHEEDIYVTSRDGVTEFSFTLPKVQV